MFVRFQSVLLLLLGVIFLSACAPTPPVRTEVTRFNQLTAIQGETFIILDLPSQRGSLEHQHYSELVSEKLESYGLRQVTDPLAAHYGIRLQYGIGNGNGQTNAMDTLLHGQAGEVDTAGTTVFVPTTLGQNGSFPMPNTMDTCFFKIDIMDIRKPIKENAVKVFEAKAISKGAHGSLVLLMPNILDAVFSDFPGKNGEAIFNSAPIKTYDD